MQKVLNERGPICFVSPINLVGLSDKATQNYLIVFLRKKKPINFLLFLSNFLRLICRNRVLSFHLLSTGMYISNLLIAYILDVSQ